VYPAFCPGVAGDAVTALPPAAIVAVRSAGTLYNVSWTLPTLFVEWLTTIEYIPASVRVSVSMNDVPKIGTLVDAS